MAIANPLQLRQGEFAQPAVIVEDKQTAIVLCQCTDVIEAMREREPTQRAPVGSIVDGQQLGLSAGDQQPVVAGITPMHQTFEYRLDRNRDSRRTSWAEAVQHDPQQRNQHHRDWQPRRCPQRRGDVHTRMLTPRHDRWMTPARMSAGTRTQRSTQGDPADDEREAAKRRDDPRPVRCAEGQRIQAAAEQHDAGGECPYGHTPAAATSHTDRKGQRQRMPCVIVHGGVPQLAVRRIKQPTQCMRAERTQQHRAGTGHTGQHAGTPIESLSRNGLIPRLANHAVPPVSYA